ncbi:hypothetical protein STEG23_022895 [Scotinomys teguina]
MGDGGSPVCLQESCLLAYNWGYNGCSQTEQSSAALVSCTAIPIYPADWTGAACTCLCSLTIMGQIFSKHEDSGILTPDLTEYFKKTEAENKVISQETIHSIESRLAKGNIQGTNSVISDALKNIDDVPINIAVTGESGAGKSSFINALRGVGHEDEGAAEVGVVETTMERNSYKHPRIKTLTLWDLPGIGTMKFPPKGYLEKMKFQEYDFFIIVSATRFTKLELDLAKAIRFMKKNYYFVRTKVDTDLENEKKSKACTFNREKVLQQIRNSYVDALKANDMDAPQVFLISNHHSSDYDFPVLMDALVKDLPALKHHNFMPKFCFRP